MFACDSFSAVQSVHDFCICDYVCTIACDILPVVKWFVMFEVVDSGLYLLS